MKRFLMTIAATALFALACGDTPTDPNPDPTPNPNADVTAPTVLSITPTDAGTGVVRNTSVTAVFSEVMAPGTITATTFVLMQGGVVVPATVTYSGTTATLVPTTSLAPNSAFAASITIGVTDTAGNALAAARNWSFTTVATSASGPMAVNLGTAGNYVILAKAGVSTTGTTSVVGDIGLSPAAATYVTGFALSSPPTTHTTSDLVTGSVFASDYDAPTPDALTTAVLDMQAAYTDAAGRTLPDFTELGAGNINGLTLVPGLYKWGTGVAIPAVVTLSGGSNDVWIFQIAQDLTVGNGAMVTLSGGAQASNVFWQVAGEVTLGTTANFKGIILSQTLIAMNTGAIMTGRALAQTAVTLDATAITQQ
ncbi:MAG: ice-binding family protein [Gemmatimonadales bacterium]